MSEAARGAAMAAMPGDATRREQAAELLRVRFPEVLHKADPADLADMIEGGPCYAAIRATRFIYPLEASS